MDNQDNLKLFSTHRSFLMGIAMIMVMLFHQQFCTSAIGASIFQWYGRLGVDIFLFLSGFGIFYSLSKHRGESIWPFYQRRLIRILPASILVGIGTAVFFKYHSTTQWVLCALGLNLWYIRSILLMYLIAPFLLKYYERHHASWHAFFLIAALTALANWLCWNTLPHFLGTSNVITETCTWTLDRFTAFSLGLFFALRATSGAKDKAWSWIVATIVFSVPALVYMACHTPASNSIEWTAIFPAVLPALFMLCVALCRIAEHAPQNILDPIRWLGEYSLEIYLIHWVVFAIEKALFTQTNGIVLIATGIALSCAAAWALHSICAALVSFVQNFCSRHD